VLTAKFDILADNVGDIKSRKLWIAYDQQTTFGSRRRVKLLSDTTQKI